MSQRPFALIRPLYDVLVGEDLNEFTVTELRDAFVAYPQVRESDLVEARRVVYTQILRLVKQELLQKVASDHPYHTRYVKTPRFYERVFQAKELPSESGCEVAETAASAVNATPSLTDALHSRLQGYRAELLTAMGESEEYQRLLKDFPEHQRVIRRQYEQARDTTTRLLGRVKAVEHLLAAAQDPPA